MSVDLLILGHVMVSMDNEPVNCSNAGLSVNTAHEC